jgi:uncharacterized membrane protein YgaE (UPF0421/DUF939 family)
MKPHPRHHPPGASGDPALTHPALTDPALTDTMAGVRLPLEPGLLTTPPRASLAALAASWVPLVQSSVAVGVSWYVAHDVIGHSKPFFAPVAALIVLAAASTDRLRRVIELALGVCVGIGIGDLLVSQIGTGSWQVALVVLIAMSAAILLGGSPTFVAEAATSGVLVATVAGGAHGSRAIDALVGGLLGVCAVIVLPQNPLRVARREAALLFSELGASLDDVAEALEQHDVAGARQALARARRAESAAVAWRESLTSGHETARLSPLHWRSRTRLDEYALAAVQLELAVRNVRVLARSVIRAAETTSDIPPELVAAVRRLANAVREVEPALELRDRSAPIESALAATKLATQAVERDPELAFAHVVGQIRSITTDLLRALGVDRDVAVEHVRRAARSR